MRFVAGGTIRAPFGVLNSLPVRQSSAPGPASVPAACKFNYAAGKHEPLKNKVFWLVVALIAAIRLSGPS